MVEVFKTNVKYREQADRLTDQIHKAFRTYKANFDLEDCDRILRIECEKEIIQPYLLLKLLKENGFYAEVLDEDILIDQGS